MPPLRLHGHGHCCSGSSMTIIALVLVQPFFSLSCFCCPGVATGALAWPADITSSTMALVWFPHWWY